MKEKKHHKARAAKLLKPGHKTKQFRAALGSGFAVLSHKCIMKYGPGEILIQVQQHPTLNCFAQGVREWSGKMTLNGFVSAGS